MDAGYLIATLEAEKALLERILSRFSQYGDALNMRRDDDPIYRQKILELRDLLADEGLIQYSHQITRFFSEGIAN
jgi:hypothetical protein